MQEQEPTKIDKKEEKRQERRERIEGSRSYRLIRVIAKWMDNYYLDPLLGLVPAGDIISAGLIIPYLYVAICKVRSLPLTLALLCNVLMDVATGLIPFWLGDVIDFFNRSYVRNHRLIVGFVEGDKEMIGKVNKRAWAMGALLVTLLVLIYFLFRLASWFLSWFFGLF